MPPHMVQVAAHLSLALGFHVTLDVPLPIAQNDFSVALCDVSITLCVFPVPLCQLTLCDIPIAFPLISFPRLSVTHLPISVIDILVFFECARGRKKGSLHPGSTSQF